MATRIIPANENPRGSASADLDTIAFYLGIGGVGWLAYVFALQGDLGTALQRAALRLQYALHGQRPPTGKSGSPPIGSKPVVSPGPAPVTKPKPGGGSAPVVAPTPISPTPGSGGVSPGYYQDGSVFLGGDAGDENNWVAFGTAPAGVRGYVEEQSHVWYVLVGPDAGNDDDWAVIYNFSQ